MNYSDHKFIASNLIYDSILDEPVKKKEGKRNYNALIKDFV